MVGGFENGDSVLTKAMAGLDGGVVLTEAIGELTVAMSPEMVGGLDRGWANEGESICKR